MKKITICLASLLIISVFAVAQTKDKKMRWKENNTTQSAGKAFNYSFVTDFGTYTNLTNATSLNNGQVWDDPSYVVNIPFTFILNGTTISSLSFDFGLGGVLGFESPNDIQFLMPFDVDLIDRGYGSGTSLSPLSYEVEGATGSRKLKIEWNNVGSYDDDDLTMYINFQLWLYETSNIIEIHFGPNMIDDPGTFYDGESGAFIGITSYDYILDDVVNSHFLFGNASMPVLQAAYATITGTPADGSVYRFVPLFPASIESNVSQNLISVYPNPAADILNISNLTGITEIQIHDYTGSQVLYQKINTEQNTIDISHLAAGLYFIIVNDNTNTVGTKFIKE